MIPIGTYVIVRYDPTAQVRNEIAHRFNGAEGKITRARNWGAHGAYYEIEGIVSQMGIPYTFAESDLVEVEDRYNLITATTEDGLLLVNAKTIY